MHQALNLVRGHGLLNPGTEVGDAGVHSRGAHIAVAGTPGHNSHLVPSSSILANQGAARITLVDTEKSLLSRKYSVQNTGGLERQTWRNGMEAAHGSVNKTDSYP